MLYSYLMSTTSRQIDWSTGTSNDLGSLEDGWVCSAPAMVHSIDVDGCIRSVSDLWLSKLGYSREEVIGVKSLDFLTPQSRTYAKAHVLPAFFETGRCQDIEYQMVAKSGVVLDVLVSGVLHKHAQVGPISLAFTTDVTEQKALERRLIENEARYRGIVEDQTEMVGLTTPDFILRFVNNAYARFYDVEPRVMIGRSLFDYVPEEQHEQVRLHLRRTMESTETQRDENRIILPDGSARWIAWSNRAIRDASGKVTALHSVGRDIDDRKRAELKLMESEARYRMLADHSTDLVFQYDRDMVRRYVSPASREIFGIEPEEMIGRKTFLETHPDEIETIQRAYQDLASGRLERAALTYRIQHRSGRWIWVEAALRSLRDPVTGEPSGLIGAIRDITAKKEVEDKLAEANRRLEILAAQDGLTEIYNRRSFDEMLSREIKIARREGTTLSLLMIDVDAFKAYNDHYGHPAGDAALRKVSSAIRSAIKRPGDLCARYGGEEFVVLLPNTDTEGAAIVAETIRSNVEVLGLEHTASAWKTVTVSVGVASASNALRESLRQDMLLKRADKSLYGAKSDGRNRVCVWREKTATRADGEV